MAPETKRDERLVLTVRYVHDGAGWIAFIGHDAGHVEAWASDRAAARKVAVGRALRDIGIAVELNELAAPAAIDIVDAPESEGR